MSLPKILLTGFGPFLDVLLNPSGEIARALDGKKLSGVQVSSRVLPAAYRSVGPAFAEALEEMAPTVPVALLSLGVHRGSPYRLEKRARPVLDSAQLDADGVRGNQLDFLGERELHTTLDVPKLVTALEDGGAEAVVVSENAGGYVCERCYYEVLTLAERLALPGFFLHVPPLKFASVEQQLAPIESMIEEIARQAI